MLELSKLVVDTKSTWMDYPGFDDFSIEIAAISRKELNALRKRSTTQTYDRKARVMVETLDEKAFVLEFTDATIKNWKGLTVKILDSLVLMDVGTHAMTEEYEYSKKHANELVTFSTEFDTWLNEVVFDLDNFPSRTETESTG